jgi:mannose-6-phosphate isomerase-like protein (cupin superfamily)
MLSPRTLPDLHMAARVAPRPHLHPLYIAHFTLPEITNNPISIAMKTSVARSTLLALALVLSLCLSLSFASRDVEEVGWRRGEEGREEWGKGRSDEGGRPYHFGEESFRPWTRTRHGHFKVLERFDDELLRGSVGDYRVACLDAAPRAFLQPSHYDADEIFYVKEGEGVLVLLRNGKRQSFCVREGDVMVIPAGSIVYSANTHRSKWLRVVMLLNPVATPGRFEVSLTDDDESLDPLRNFVRS